MPFHRASTRRHVYLMRAVGHPAAPGVDASAGHRSQGPDRASGRSPPWTGSASRSSAARSSASFGSNGCGKTTTMKMLTGLLAPSEGMAEVYGQPVDANDSVRRGWGS